MSHIECPKCKTRNHTSGYGLAAGPMGSYTFCNDCDMLLEFMPDLDDLDDDEAERIRANVDRWRKETWPNGIPEGSHMREPQHD